MLIFQAQIGLVAHLNHPCFLQFEKRSLLLGQKTSDQEFEVDTTVDERLDVEEVLYALNASIVDAIIHSRLLSTAATATTKSAFFETTDCSAEANLHFLEEGKFVGNKTDFLPQSDPFGAVFELSD
jgi:hypothetical protein